MDDSKEILYTLSMKFGGDPRLRTEEEVKAAIHQRAAIFILQQEPQISLTEFFANGVNSFDILQSGSPTPVILRANLSPKPESRDFLHVFYVTFNGFLYKLHSNTTDTYLEKEFRDINYELLKRDISEQYIQIESFLEYMHLAGGISEETLDSTHDVRSISIMTFGGAKKIDPKEVFQPISYTPPFNPLEHSPFC